MPLPEAFISAIAWRVFDSEIADKGSKAVGLRYRGAESNKPTLEVRSTAPHGKELVDFGNAMATFGVLGEAPVRTLGLAASNSVNGVTATRSDSQAVSPLTPSLALLQNFRGMLGVRNPPDLGAIIEHLFQLGGGSSAGGSASALWKSAVLRRLELDPLLTAIDHAADNALLDTPRTEREPRPVEVRGLLPSAHGTPFEWFKDSWVTLTSNVWVEALPARVWVDWATTVLRLGFGLGYLWESLWYETLARQLLTQRDGPLSWEEVRMAMPTVVPWRSSRNGVQARDVAPLLIRRSFHADLVRHTFEHWSKDISLAEMDFEDVCVRMRSDSLLMDKLQSDLRSTQRAQSGKNLWEASQYALQTRTVAGSSADYYGLFRRNGRYMTPEPGTEWIAVVASLACERPGATTTVARVLDDLDRMGVRPELVDLVALLERAGLARGSADADQAVLVQSAF